MYLPTEIFCKILRYLPTATVAKLAGLNRYLTEICYDRCHTHVTSHLYSYQDVLELGSLVDQDLIGTCISTLVISEDLADSDELILLAARLHIVTLVGPSRGWHYVVKIPHEHLVLHFLYPPHFTEINILLSSPGTLELDNYRLIANDFSRIESKLLNTYVFMNQYENTLISKGIINTYIITPFRILYNHNDITDHVQALIRNHLGGDPTRDIYYLDMKLGRCWQCDRYDVPNHIKHIFVEVEFDQSYYNIQSLLVPSLVTIMNFSTEVSRSNMSRISKLFVIFDWDVELFRQVTSMYPHLEILIL